MILRPRSRPILVPALRGAVLAAFALGGCSVGIDDRPVPPEPIPGMAFQQANREAGYGGPVIEDAVSRTPPAFSAARTGADGAGDLVWQAGAQPVVSGRSELAPPEPGGEDAASAAPEPDAPAPQDAAEPETATLAPEEARVFRLAPFVGIDAEAARPLREAMAAEAADAGIRLTEGDETLVLKGYLSSMEDGGTTVLNYVWDVYDASGTRLTRIDGHQKVAGDAGGAPLHIDEATARLIAARTVAALARWQPGETG